MVKRRFFAIMKYGSFLTRLKKGYQVTRNVGNIERLIRILFGIGLIAIVFVGPKTVWGWIGVVPLLTGLVGWCPPYQLLGFNTCKMKKD